MDLLFFAKNFYSPQKVSGGTEIYLYHLLQKLPSRWTQGRVLLLLPHRYNITLPNVTVYHYYEISLPFLEALSNFISLLFILPYITFKHKIGAGLVYIPSFAGACVLFWARICRIKAILNLRGEWPTNNFLIKLLGGFCFNFANLFVANSSHLFKYYAQTNYTISHAYLHHPHYFLPNGIDLAYWQPKTTSDMQIYDVCFIGNIQTPERVYKKGFDRFIKIIHQSIDRDQETSPYHETNHRLRVAVVGQTNPPLLEKLELESLENLVDFHFLGYLKVSDVREVLKTSKILILSSRVEGMPNILMQGLAVGCYIITTDVGSTSSLIQSGYNGYLVSAANEVELIQAFSLRLKELLKDTEKYSVYLHHGFSTISQYGWDAHISRLKTIILKSKL